MKFSDKLAKQRKANNLSQEQLAEALGITRQSVSKWESGDSYPDMAKIIQICKILNCSLNDIIDDGVMGEIKQEEEKSSRNYVEDFLGFVTKTNNMLMHMRIREKLAMLFELVMIAGFLALISLVLCGGIEYLLSVILSILPHYIAYRIVDFLMVIVIVVVVLVDALVFFHLFKIRYLDYYVTITDSNVLEQTTEEPITENLNTSELAKSTKSPKIVIRDPNHASSKFFQGLGKVIIFILKITLAFCLCPVAAGLVACAAGIVICIGMHASFFMAVAVALLGGGILCFLIIYYVYNVLFTRIQPYRVLLIILVSGLVITGIGSGLTFQEFMKLESIDSKQGIKTVTDTFEIKEFQPGNKFYTYNTDQEIYVLDESVQGIIVNVYHSDVTTVEHWQSSGEAQNYYVTVSDSTFESFKRIVQDLKEGTIRNSYDDSISSYEVEIRCNQELYDYFMSEEPACIADSAKYYLYVGEENAAKITVSGEDFSGGVINADGSLFKKGERVWLESLDGCTEINGVEIIAYDADENELWGCTLYKKDFTTAEDGTEAYDDYGEWSITKETE